MGRERMWSGSVGTLAGERAQRERLPGPVLKADTGWGVMRIVEALVCGYGVPYQAAVPD